MIYDWQFQKRTTMKIRIRFAALAPLFSTFSAPLSTICPQGSITPSDTITNANPWANFSY